MKVLLLLLSFTLVGCLDKPESIAGALAGSSTSVVGEFSLKPGEQTTLGEEALTIKLISISNDSRCPTDVVCVWPGNAEVNVELTRGAAPSFSIRLNTSAIRDKETRGEYSDQAGYLNYTIRLVALQPYPTAGTRILRTAYVAKFIVSKQKP